MKDPSYKFSCQSGINWFTNRVLIHKIKRKYQNENITPGGDDETVVKLILEEYDRNKVYFNRLISLDPKEESAL